MATALLVGVNGDDATRQLKGAGRPVNSETDRAAVLAALASVDGVCVFADKTAIKFLSAARPDIYVKGGDYTLDTLNQDERRAVESGGRENRDHSVCAGQIHDGVARKNFTALTRSVMRFLMLNWRDPKNPLAGGAERVTLAYLVALVERGHEVFWFGNDFPGAAREEMFQGIKIVRGGGRGFFRAEGDPMVPATAAF